MPGGWDAIQRDLHRLKNWACVILTRLNKAKRKVLPPRRGNPRYQYRLGMQGGRAALLRRTSGSGGWAMTQQCVLAAQKPTMPWAASPAAWVQGEGGDSAPLPRSAETPQEPCVQLWSPQHRAELELWERGQRRPQQWSKGWNPSAGRKGWESWGWAAWQCLKGASKEDGDRLFRRACSDRARGNGFKLKEGRFRLDIRKKFFTVRVVKPWPRLPREVGDAPSLEPFQARSDGALSNLIQVKMSLLFTRGWTRWSLEVPSNPNHSMILWSWKNPTAYFLLAHADKARSSKARPCPSQLLLILQKNRECPPNPTTFCTMRLRCNVSSCRGSRLWIWRQKHPALGPTSPSHPILALPDPMQGARPEFLGEAGARQTSENTSEQDLLVSPSASPPASH